MLQDEKFGPERSEVLMGGGGFDSATVWGSDQIPKLLIPLGRAGYLQVWLQDPPMGEQLLQERTCFLS